MPDLDHTALEAAARAATSREWLADGCVVARRGRVHRSAHEVARTVLPQDAAYIAAACNALPALLEERKRLIEALEAYADENVNGRRAHVALGRPA